MKYPKKISVLLLIVIFIFLSIGYCFIRIKPSIVELCTKETESIIRIEINAANETILSKGLVYNELFTIKETEDNVYIVSANSGLINQISMLWGTEIQNNIDKNDTFDITEPMGVFTGSPFFADFGRDITMQCHYAASSRTEYHSEFISKGINQTLHRLYLVAYVEVKMISPVKTETFFIDDTFLFCESIINGKVPETYISSGNYLEYLDLLQ